MVHSGRFLFFFFSFLEDAQLLALLRRAIGLAFLQFLLDELSNQIEGTLLELDILLMRHGYLIAVQSVQEGNTNNAD